MNTKSLIPVVLLAAALPSLAQTSQNPSVSQSSDPAAILRADPYLQAPQPARPNPSAMRLGDSDYIVTGPVIEGINRSPAGPAAAPTLWTRIALFPVYVLTPLPADMPPEKAGSYFKWKTMSTQPWVNVSSGMPPTTDDPAITHEPVPLISIGK